MNNNKTRKVTVIIVTLLMLLEILFSCLYIYEHSDHDCSGEECQVCHILSECINNLKNVGTGVLNIQNITSIVMFMCICSICYMGIFKCNSLVIQKVRMNN